MNPQLQSLRGLACLLLVLYHVVGADPGRGLRVGDGALRLLVDTLAAVRMPLFALLAGALYGLRPKAGGAALADKFRRLVVPALTVGTAFAAVQALVPGTNQQVIDWHLLHIVPVAHFWFLESLFLVFAVVMLAERGGWLQRPRGFALVFAAAAAAYLAHPGFIWFGVAGMVYLLPYFLAGMALVRYGGQQRLRSPWAMPALLAGGALVLALWAPPAHDQNRYSLAMLAAGLMLSTGLWLRPVKSAWLGRVGDVSYTVFLFHAFFTAATRIGLERLGVQALAPQVLAGLVIGVAGPMLLHRALMRSALLRAWVLGLPERAATAPKATASALAMPALPQR